MARIINAASEKHEKMMKRLAEFARVDSIEYRDLGTGEDYVLRIGERELTLKVRGNRVDGAFLVID